jgi:hypothetical protein
MGPGVTGAALTVWVCSHFLLSPELFLVLLSLPVLSLVFSRTIALTLQASVQPKHVPGRRGPRKQRHVHPPACHLRSDADSHGFVPLTCLCTNDRQGRRKGMLEYPYGQAGLARSVPTARHQRSLFRYRPRSLNYSLSHARREVDPFPHHVARLQT